MCCCVSDDRKCDYKGGDCKMTKKGCKGGYWTTGDCAGPADRKCCIQDGMLLIRDENFPLFIEFPLLHGQFGHFCNLYRSAIKKYRGEECLEFHCLAAFALTLTIH